MTTPRRDYTKALERMLVSEDRDLRMQAIVDALWDAFKHQGYSWVGFYLDRPDAPADERLVLGPRRDKPACSPIGLHGACGKALLTRETVGTPLAGWFSFQPLYDVITAEQPELLD